MMMRPSQDLGRAFTQLRAKLFSLVGRTVLSTVTNGGKTQLVQVKALAGEDISDVERMQEYGLETYPEAGAEAIALFLNGNRDQGLVLCVHDRRHRPTTLSPGEVMLYTKESDHCVYLKVGRGVEVRGSAITIKGDTIVVEGSSVKVGAASGHKAAVLETLITAFNSHTHPTAAVGAPSTPAVPLVAADHVTQETKLT